MSHFLFVDIPSIQVCWAGRLADRLPRVMISLTTLGLDRTTTSVFSPFLGHPRLPAKSGRISSTDGERISVSRIWKDFRKNVTVSSLNLHSFIQTCRSAASMVGACMYK